MVTLALGLRVARVEIFHEEHSGGTDVAGADRLPLVDTIAICLAGMNANHMFKAPSHDLAAFQDHACVHNLISDVAEAKGDVLRDKGHQRAWDLLGLTAASPRQSAIITQAFVAMTTRQ